MWDNLIEEKQVYVYELSDSRFKEIKANLRIFKSARNQLRAVATNEKNINTVYKVSPEECKIYGNFIWMEKRCKERAAEIFSNYLKAQLTKQQNAIDVTESKLNLIGKYYEGKK